jgi:hypothetical protein
MIRRGGLRKWWLVGGALALVAAMVVAVIVVQRPVDGRPQSAPPMATAEQLGLPKQLLLSQSMRKQPVFGWHVTAAELGLPADSMIHPAGNVGDRGFFLGASGDGWRVVGVNVADGHRLFAPVRLGPNARAASTRCFVNGPAMLLCVWDASGQPRRAWVVNTETGAVMFDGPTELRAYGSGPEPRLSQVGDYVVAAVPDSGVHGVGPHAELTWFVPGDGLLGDSAGPNSDLQPMKFASQGVFKAPDIVFSVADGVSVKPSAGRDASVGSAIVYAGGFGFSYHDQDGTERVALLDEYGRLSAQMAGGLVNTSPDVPIVEDESQLRVVTMSGRQLLEIPKPTLRLYARLIGTTLYVASDKRLRSWQQFDLRTGAKGKACDAEGLSTSYIGSDGAIAILTGEPSPVAYGMDMATCETAWAMPGTSSPDVTVREVWRVNTTLLGRGADDLFSLVPQPK